MTGPRDTGPVERGALSRIKTGVFSTIRNMRHELRTSLNQILGYSELLEEELEDLDEQELIGDVRKIHTAASNMLETINSIFDSDMGAVEVSEPPPQQPGQATPAAAVPAPAAETEGALPPAHGALLVVDDSEANRDMLARRLIKQGYDVSTASGGAEALRMLVDEPASVFDLVLLDVMMPGVNGLEVLETVRRTISMDELPVIMVTALDGSDDMVRAFEMGANDYVTKPIDLAVVLARVRTQLSLKEGADEIRKLAGQLELRNVFIRKTFGRYLSNEIVDQLLATPEGLQLGGEKRTVTVLMSDLRGFSTISERLQPEQVVALMNNYLSVMTDVITRHQGTIDEFIGDAILTIFGAPIQREDDTARAVACALDMQLAMGTVNRWNHEHGLPAIHMGVGIHAGEVVVGNIGSRKRSKYAVVGAPVNLAARIESYTLRGQVLLSEETLAQVRELVTTKTSFEVSPKGVPRVITLHEVESIGGPYSLSLSSSADELRPLPQEVPFQYQVEQAKRFGEDHFWGHMLQLGHESARVRLQGPLAERTNLKLTLLDAAGEPAPGTLQAKVLAAEGDVCTLGFTYVDPEVEQRLGKL